MDEQDELSKKLGDLAHKRASEKIAAKKAQEEPEGGAVEIFGEHQPPPPPVFVLNADQQKALDYLVDFVNNDDHPFRWGLLEGWAGTGKTFTINRVIEAIRKNATDRKAFGMTAPTHKAVRQLKKHSELKKELDFGTIHSFLGLQEEVNQKTGKVKYVLDWSSKRERKIDNIDVLILDEASMLRDGLFGHIDDVMRNRKYLKVIFMGDGLQIPPVRDDDDKANGTNLNAIPFIEAQRFSRKMFHLQLNEIVRQGAGNPIIEYSAAIREQVKKQDVIFKFSHTDDSGVEEKARNRETLLPLFEKYFCTPEFDADPDYAKVICYRNDSVKYFNQEIRLLINKAETLPRIIEGEKLIMNKALTKGERIMIANNEELVVTECVLAKVPVRYKLIPPDKDAFQKMTEDVETKPDQYYHEITFEAYKCKVVTGDDRVFIVHIIHENSEATFNKIKEQLKDAAFKLQSYERSEMWKQFYKLDSHFAWVGYNYAITTHKSQGSTYDYSISMEWDMVVNRDFQERNRIRYVAATRARKKLFVFR